MTIKDMWTKISSWLNAHKLTGLTEPQPVLDNEGLISQRPEPAHLSDNEPCQVAHQNNHVVVKPSPRDKNESLEKLQEGFNKFIDQLHAIEGHLNRQATQNENLINRMDQLPGLLESFTTVMGNQKQLTAKLLEQLQAMAAKDQQFIDIVEKIPTQTLKQTDCLVDINHQLTAAANIDVQMAENFNKFTGALEKLNQNTAGQTDSITQMNKTFTASDRYLKYLMSQQNKRFMWIFMTAISVCVLVVSIMTGIIIYLKR